MAEVDDFLASMKRTALDMELSRAVRESLPAGLFNPDAPRFRRPGGLAGVQSVRLLLTIAARQGFDAGRFGGDCPYPLLTSRRDTLARRAWLIGFTEGLKVQRP